MKKINTRIGLKTILAIALLLITGAFTARAQTLIPIETKDNAVVLQVTPDNYLNIVYFGKRLKDKSEYQNVTRFFHLDENGVFNSAYTGTTRNLLEPAIAITHADGNKTVDLKYIDHVISKISDDVSLVSIRLKDPAYAVEVTLFYKIYYADNVIEQWNTIEHHEKRNITLNKYASANLLIQAKCYWLKQYHGEWAQEMRPEETMLTHGIKTLDSKLGARADIFQPPSFMVSLDKPASEDEGDVLLGNLEWSGNFRIDFEVDPTNNLRLMAGINNYASDYSLKPGEEFETPKLVYTFAHHGSGEASRNMQDWARKYKIVDGEGPRLTLLNNWESTYFDFNESKLSGLLKDTKKLGVDLFLLDDGWFGNKYPRNDDRAGLGDWQVNKSKLPNGIAHLVKEAQDNDVKFGIWVGA